MRYILEEVIFNVKKHFVYIVGPALLCYIKAMNLIGQGFGDIYNLVREKKLGGKQEAKALFSDLYNKGIAPEEYSSKLPDVSGKLEEGGTIKFLLKLEDGLETESIILPMGGRYYTLCLSSQIGCRWSCAFCETGKMGMVRNLTVYEILAQLMTAQLVYKKPIRNIVFMGMGEAFDNFDNVIKAIDIISHPWAMGIHKKSICISTVGHVEGIGKLTELAGRRKEDNYHKLHLAVSLNGSDDQVRSELMPVNRRWPMEELKEALMKTEQFGKKDLLYLEYIMIKGVTDGVENGEKLIAFASQFPKVTINLIPFNPGRKSPFEKTETEERYRFHDQLLEAGIRVFTRISQGERIMAACGQLGNK